MKTSISRASLIRSKKGSIFKFRLVLPALIAGLLSALTIPFFGCGGAAGDFRSASRHANDPRPATYTVTDLGTLPGGSFSAPGYINNNGVVAGSSNDVDGISHAVLWVGGQIMDISNPGLGGPNSGAFGFGANGQAGGFAESSVSDPNNENFCGLFTGLNCLPFLRQNGTMSALPLLGGNNGEVNLSNSRGVMIGVAENGTKDSQCLNTAYANGDGPQVLDFEAVIWDPNTGQMRQLNPLSGDTVAEGLGINDNGQAVGTSGSCANTYNPPFVAGPHAVMWDADGTVHDLGNLGGTANPNVLGVGNVAFGINDTGEVAGISAVSGSQVGHPFLWTQNTGMQELDLLPGDVMGAGLAINGLGVVVGASLDAPPPTGNPTAVMWQNGVITNLNEVVPAGTSLYLLTAFSINDAGQIVGIAFDPASGQVHAFLASPIPGGGPAARGPINRPQLPDSAWQFVQKHDLR